MTENTWRGRAVDQGVAQAAGAETLSIVSPSVTLAAIILVQAENASGAATAVVTGRTVGKSFTVKCSAATQVNWLVLP